MTIATATARSVRMVRHVLGRARERLCEPRESARNAAVRDAIERLAYELRSDSVEVQLYLAKVLARLAATSRRPAGSRILTLTPRRHTGRPWVQLAIADSGAWVLVVDHGTDRAPRVTDPLGGDDDGT